MDLLVNGGQLAMFLKIQFLEGSKREALFRKYPPEVRVCIPTESVGLEQRHEAESRNGEEMVEYNYILLVCMAERIAEE